MGFKIVGGALATILLFYVIFAGSMLIAALLSITGIHQ